MLAGIGRAFVDSLSDVNLVFQKFVKVALIDELAALCRHTLPQQVVRESSVVEPTARNRSKIIMTVAASSLLTTSFRSRTSYPKWHRTAHPYPFLSAGRDLVADPLAGDLAFELGKGQKDVERQPPHGCGCVKRLGHGHEGHIVTIKNIDQLCEVHERTAQAINFIDHDNIDLTGLNVAINLCRAGRSKRSPGNPTVVIWIGDQHPAFLLLAGDIGFARLSLGMKAVEFQVEVRTPEQ